jgi:signal peptidase I
VVVGTTALVLRAAVLATFSVSSVAMSPALQPVDIVGVRKGVFAEAITPGEVVVFRHPAKPDVDFVHRVIAVAGQTVSVVDGVVSIDGVALPRARAVHPEALWEKDCAPMADFEAWREQLGGHTYVTLTAETYTRRIIDVPSFTVPPGQLYVMGDNRDNSADSRIWGTVPVENVHGVVAERFLSIDWCTGAFRFDRVGPLDVP